VAPNGPWRWEVTPRARSPAGLRTVAFLPGLGMPNMSILNALSSNGHNSAGLGESGCSALLEEASMIGGMDVDALDVVLIVIGLVMACVSIAAIMGRRKIG
jgi:hypothetical protein